jgi:DNA topoisomerase-1
MNLVIVESPSKCSKIQGFLGTGWKVLASMGHIRHLIEDLKALHIEDGFNPDYEFMKDKYKTIMDLKNAAKDAKIVYLASDDDREGEAISYSVALALHLNIKTNPRIVFHEITKSAITKAIQSPRTINMNRVNSQQARAVLDLMIGFTISPLLWRFVGPSLSAGRCQTPALRIIVEREKEIKNFKNQSFWKVSGNWSYKTSKFLGTMTDQLEDEESALNYLENVNTTITAAITNVNTKPTYQNPPLPLITSSLQQEASAIYNSNPKNTMKIAQKLYEAGHITYMRTDSTILSEEAIVEAQKLVEEKYGKEYLNVLEKKKENKKENNAQEAHEAIRPTHFNVESLSADFNVQEKNIYNLIYKRALQCVMAPMKGEERKIQWQIEEDSFIYEKVWKRTIFQGWKIIGQNATNLDDEEDDIIEDNWSLSQSLTIGTKITWNSLQASEQITNAAPRYNEATLVRELEKKGIGRPSTFASLVASIVDKEYVKIDKEPKIEVKLLTYFAKPNTLPCEKSIDSKMKSGDKQKMIPTVLGTQVYEFCMKEFSELFNYGFTKHMEDRLDLVESGIEEWRKVCGDTYNSYKEKYETLKKVPAKEISNSKKIVLSNGYEAVIGKFGPVLVKDKQFLGWPEKVEFKNITDDLVKKFLEEKNKPDIFGYHDEKPLIRKKGKFGEYIEYDGKNISLKAGDTVESIIEKLNSKSDALHMLGDYIFKTGQYGNYMYKKTTANKKPTFVSIPSGIDVKQLTLEAAKTIYENGINKPKKTFKKKE